MYTPSSAECLRFEVNLQQRINTFVALETARRSICCYTADPCDCKYGGEHPAYPGTEATGCPELRDLIYKLTGWQPFVKHPERTPAEHGEMLAEWTRDDWLQQYSAEVEDFANTPPTERKT